MSDYDQSTLDQNVEEIRNQLGILEATSVPDLEDEQHAPIPEMTASGVISSVASLNAVSSDTCATSVSPVEDETNPQTEAELLAVFFPRLSQQEIKHALAAEPTLDAVIDHLLSVELIRGVQRTGVWPDEPPEEDDSGEWAVGASRLGSNTSAGAMPTVHTQPGNLQEELSTKLIGKTKKPKPSRLTIPLVDTLQRRPAALATSTPNAYKGPASGPSSHVWSAFSSLAGFLTDIVPRAPASFFLSFLHSPDYMSAHEAVVAALASLAATASEHEPSPEAVRVLEAMYDVSLDDEEPAHNLHICLRAAEGDMASVMDLMDMLTELTWWPDYEAAKEQQRNPFAMLADLDSSLPPSRTSSRASSRPPSSAGSRPLTPSAETAPTRVVNPNRLTRPAPALSAAQKEKVVKAKGIPGSRPTNSAYKSAQDAIPTSTRWAVHAAPFQSQPKGHVLNWRTVAPKKRVPRQSAHPLAASIPSYARGELPDGSSMTSSDCYARGEIEWQKRVSAIRTAAQHFGAGGRKDIAAMKAGYYAAEARRATAAAREWELEGARMAVDAQLSRKGNTVDLHHATVDQAVTLALETAEQWWSKPDRSNRLTVVTGKGLHSASKRGVLGPAVARALEEDGWRVERSEGSIAVLGR